MVKLALGNYMSGKRLVKVSELGKEASESKY